MIKVLMKNNWLRKVGPVGFLWLAGMMSNLSGWVFSLLANRSLTLTDMGHLGFYTNVILIVSIFSVAFNISANKFYADKKNKSQVGAVGKMSGLVGIWWFGVYVLTSVWWRSYFRIPFTMGVVVGSGSLFLIMSILAWWSVEGGGFCTVYGP